MCICFFRLYITFDFCCFLSCFLLNFFKSLIKYYGSFFCCFLTLFCWNRITRFSFYYFSVLVGSLVCIEKISVVKKSISFDRSFEAFYTV